MKQNMEPAATTQFLTAHFGTCHVNVAQREVRLNDELQTLPNKAFDLLVVLIERHGEVLSKALLCQRLWGDRRVGENLLAKTVVQLRQAIGDDATRTRWIKTVHCVGYRFVGEVTKWPPALPASVALSTAACVPAVPSEARRRIALLPLENHTREPQFVWVELGLATLIGQALESNERISVIPMPTVLRALEGVRPEASARERAASVLTLLGAHSVVFAKLSRAGHGLRLDHWTSSAAGLSAEGSLDGEDAVQLGEHLARQLSDRLLPQSEQALRFDSDDPFVNQLLARAMQLHVERRWCDSIRMLQASLIVEPRNLAARVLLVRNLAITGDKSAFALGNELLREARQRGDERLQASVHVALARGAVRRDLAEAHDQLDQALRLCKPYAQESWVAPIHLLAAVRAHWQRDLASARTHFTVLVQQSGEIGDQLTLGLSTIDLALVEIDAGHRLLARSLQEEASALAQRNGWKTMQTHALGDLAATNVALGAISSGFGLFAKALALAESVDDTYTLGSLLINAIDVHADTGSGDELRLLLDRWAALADSEMPLLRAVYTMAQGQRAAHAGDTDNAQQHMRRAIGLITEVGHVPMTHSWLCYALESELRSGDVDAVRQLADEIKSLPSAADDADLRASLLHAEAVILHGRGRRGAAVKRLKTAASVASLGRVKARTLLDAAWLHLESGDLPAADDSLKDLGPWLAEHPAGLLVEARRQFALGNPQAAEALQRASVKASRRAPSACWTRLLSCYEAAAIGGAAESPAISPELPSTVRIWPTTPRSCAFSVDSTGMGQPIATRAEADRF